MAIEVFEVKIPIRHWYPNYDTARQIITNEITTWLKDNVGNEEKDWTWTIFFPDGGLVKTFDLFRFNNEEDRIKFILRWV